MMASTSGVDQEMLKKMEEIIKADGGGLSLHETAGALKTMLKHKQDVYVIYEKNLCGVAQYDNFFIKQEFEKWKDKFPTIVFPYAITEDHQVSVVIRDNILTVTDSLERKRNSDPNLSELAQLLSITSIKDGESNFEKQDPQDNWASGVFTLFNTIDVIDNNKSQSKTKLQVKQLLPRMLKASEEYQKIEEMEQKKRTEKRINKTRILEAIERIRHKEGNFLDAESNDDLKYVADTLQIELWGNLDRKKSPNDNSGRNQDSEEKIRERPIEELISEYETKEDVLGMILLHVLQNTHKHYDNIIAYHRSLLENDEHPVVRRIHKSDSQSKKLELIAQVYEAVGNFSKALQLYEEALAVDSGDDHSTSARLYNCIGWLYYKLGRYGDAETYLNKAYMKKTAT